MKALVVVAALGGCWSAPPPTTHPVVATVTTDAPIAPDAHVEAPDGDPDSHGTYVYRFAWQQLRDEYDAFLQTPVGAASCDHRASRWKPTLGCPGPLEMAGRAILALRGSRFNTTGIRIDRGARDAINLKWTVALLDEDGRPVTPWSPVTRVERGEALADVEINYLEGGRYRRVGMRIARQDRVPWQPPD